MNNIIINEERYFNMHKKQIKNMLREYMKSTLIGYNKFKSNVLMLENAVKMKNNLALWVIDRGEGPIGYSVTIPVPDEYGNPILSILQFYTDSRLVTKEETKAFLDKICLFGKETRCSKILMQTTRKRNPMRRFLGPSWMVGPTIFYKTHEQPICK